MTTTIPTLRMGRREWILLLILSMLWGGSFFLYKILVAEVPPFTVAFGRVAIAAVALNLLLLLRGERLAANPRTWGGFLLLGLLNNVIPFSLIAYGETRISGGLASILNAMTPIFTVLAAHWCTTHEKLNWGKVVGVLCGFAGVTVLIGPAALHQAGNADAVGEASCLLAALSYAFAGIYGRRFREMAPLKVATGQITAGAALLAPLSLIVDKPWTLAPPSVGIWASFLAIALLCTALAFLIYFRILAVAGATNLLLVTFLIPISAVLLDLVVLHQAVTTQAIIGMAIIGTGLAAIDGRLPARLFYRHRRVAQRAAPLVDAERDI